MNMVYEALKNRRKNRNSQSMGLLASEDDPNEQEDLKLPQDSNNPTSLKDFVENLSPEGLSQLKAMIAETENNETSPELKAETEQKEIDAGEEAPEVDDTDEAEKVLGRKPFQKAGSKGEAMNPDEIDPSVLDEMSDSRVQERIKGKKPKKLWEKVQANIAGMKN